MALAKRRLARILHYRKYGKFGSRRQKEFSRVSPSTADVYTFYINKPGLSAGKVPITFRVSKFNFLTFIGRYLSLFETKENKHNLKSLVAACKKYSKIPPKRIYLRRGRVITKEVFKNPSKAKSNRHARLGRSPAKSKLGPKKVLTINMLLGKSGSYVARKHL